MRTSTALAALLLAVTLAACANSEDTRSTPTSPSPELTATTEPTTPSPTPTATPTPTPTATPTPTPTPTRPAGPRAKDGFNYAACRDARCEIYVRTGAKVPVRRSVAGFATLQVTKVSSTGVDFSGSTATTSVGAGGQQPGFHFRLNNLTVVTVAINPPLAILRLSPA